jgi:cytochrome bd-type quinol oxidase subunit 2
LVIGLSLIGVLLIYRHMIVRKELSPGLLWLSIVLLILYTIFAIQMVFRNGVIEYFRIFSYAAVVAPLFIGITLSAAVRIIERNFNRTFSFVGSVFMLLTLFAIAFIQIFPYQPIVPKSTASQANAGISEPVVYLHSVSTNYLNDLLVFARDRHQRACTLVLTS